MIRKNNQKKLILTCILLTAMVVLVTWMTKQEPGASAGNTSASTSTETSTQPETTPIDPAPAIIGGAAAIVVYYGGSLLIDTLKNKGGKNKSDQPSAPKSKKKK